MKSCGVRKRRKRRPRRRWPPIKQRAEPRAVTGAARRAASRNAHSSTTTSSGRDLEAAILREIEAFILELGTGFAFLERQKRSMVDTEEHYLDLLFYQRGRRRLVVIDLKLREFKPGDKGQMEFHLRWLDRSERKPGEKAPIGQIVCAGLRHETVELPDLEKSGNRVSSDWTEVLLKEQLQRKLREAVRLARARLAEKPEAKKSSAKRKKLR